MQQRKPLLTGEARLRGRRGVFVLWPLRAVVSRSRSARAGSSSRVTVMGRVYPFHLLRWRGRSAGSIGMSFNSNAVGLDVVYVGALSLPA